MPPRPLLILSLMAAMAVSSTAAAQPQNIARKLKLTARAIGNYTVAVTVSCPQCSRTGITRFSLIRRDLQSVTAVALLKRKRFRSALTVMDNVENEGIFTYAASLTDVRGRVIASGKKKIYVPGEEDPSASPTPGLPQPTAIPTLSPYDLPAGQTECESAAAQTIFDGINAQRVNIGMPALSREESLTRAGLIHSSKMASAGDIGHDNFYSEITQSGFTGSGVGQNVAFISTNDPATVVKGWMESPGHRSVITDPNWTWLGVGCVLDSTGYWWTTNFGH